jgi:hypothetical protein
VSCGVRSPTCAGVDGGAHALVQCAARPRSVPRQLSRPSRRDLPAAGRVDGGSGIRPSSTHVARRPTGMGCARVGPLTSSPRSSGCAASSRRRSSPTARPASLDETPGRECRCCAWRRGVSTLLCQRSDGRSTKRRIRSLDHACCWRSGTSNSFCCVSRTTATSTRPPPRRQRWRHRAGAVGGDARLRPSNYAHARTGVKRPETLCVAPASGGDIADVPHL